MSYYDEVRGTQFSGLGATLAITHAGSAAVRSLQQGLARLGFLQGDSSSSGADGVWGPTTAAAVAAAAHYLGYAGAPSTPISSSSVTVPDELIARIGAGAPAPAGTPGTIPGWGAPIGTSTSTLTAPGPSAPVVEEAHSWLPWAIGFGGVAGALIGWYALTQSAKPSVTANRRRRARRNRRRRR